MREGEKKETNQRLLTLFKFRKYLKEYRGDMNLAIVGGVFSNISNIVLAAFCAYMAGVAAIGRLTADKKWYFALLVGLAFLRAVSGYVEKLAAHKAAYHILADFRIRLFDAVERISPSLLLNMRSGELSTTLMSDVEMLEWFFAHTYGSAIVAIIVPVLVLVYLGSLSLTVALEVLVFTILVMITPFVKRKKADIQGKEVREKLSRVNGDTVEGIQGMREVLSMNWRKGYFEKLDCSMVEFGESQVKYGKRLGGEGCVTEFLMGIALIVVIATAGFETYSGNLSFEYLLVCIVLSIYIFLPVYQISFMARTFGLITAAAQRVFNVLEAKPLVEDRGEDIDVSNINPSVEFKNVSFSYGNQYDFALKNVSFKIEKGECVALVGHSGAGKTTCANLLLRLWDPDSGYIAIGGKDIREMSIANLRTLTSAVLQDVYLFNTSIDENIRLGKYCATDEEVKQAAEGAGINEFIEGLPEGYSEIAGERGVQMSGGQRQRVSIARAILKDSEILILDEAVSNVDSENEREIQASLSRLREEKTTLVIAHRLSTILDADRIVVLDHGKVVQQDTHENLIKQEGVYRDIIIPQMKIEESLEK